MSNRKLLGTLRFMVLDILGGTKIRTTINALNKEQYYPAEHLKEVNKTKLDSLFTLARTSTTFYQYTQSYDTLEVLEKDMVRTHFDAFRSRYFKDKLYTKATGGSSGMPLVYLTTAKSRSYMWAGIVLAWQVAGYELGDKVAFIAGSALSKHNWKHHIFYKIFNIDLYSVFDLSDQTIANYLEALKKSNAAIIYGYANAINHIANYIHTHQAYQFPKLKGICCTSEVLTEKMRENIKLAFQVDVFNQYGCNEAGISAFECEAHKLHLISSRSYAQVDNEFNLVSTDLSNEGFIMLKYNTGDRVVFSDETNCPCGRNYPIIDTVIGRSCEIIEDGKGHTLHAFFFHLLFRNDKRIRQFQVGYNANEINIYLSVDPHYANSHLYDMYLQKVKKYLVFDKYQLHINHPFLIASNAKHVHIVKET